MKRLLCLFLASLTFATPLLAATDPPLCTGSALGLVTCQPYQQFRTSDRRNHVMVIRPNRWDVLGGNARALRRCMFNSLGTTLETMRLQGLEVHEYDSNFFETDKDHREMWTDAGSKYALAIILYPASSTASFARYVCADSTNVQLVVVGGASESGSTGWGADTTVRGFVDGKMNYIAASHGNGAALITWDGVDTVWSGRMGCGRLKTLALPTGMNSVVRLFKPITLSGSTFVQDADSVNSFMPGCGPGVTPACQGQFPDSVVGPNQYMGFLWKTKFDNYSGQGVSPPSNWINSLASSVSRGANDGGLSPREVYFLKTADASVYTQVYPQFLWALICRFTNAQPIKFGYEWDDVTDKFFDNNGTPARWSATAVATALAGLRPFGITPSTMINPDNAAAYIRGTKPRYESVWTGAPHSYLQSATWIHHSHDSTTSHISSSLVGQAGGYGTGNGGTILLDGTNVDKFGHRYASRWNPGANEGGFIGAGGNFGIVQRLAYSDSVHRVVAPNAVIPPYLTFGANRMLPVGWKPRATTANPLWTPYFSAGYECPLDSLMWAFDTMLVNRNAAGGPQALYLRMDQQQPRAQSFEWDRDSVVALSPFHYPNEQFTIPVRGRLVHAVSVGSFTRGSATRAQYVQDACFQTAWLLGLKNPIVRSENGNPLTNVCPGDAGCTGSALSTDINGVYVSSAGGGVADGSARQATRVCYQHPGQASDVVTANGDYQVDVFIRTIATQLRIMDKLALRRASQCVPAWQITTQ